LLAIDDSPRLHESDRVLRLLQDDSAEEVRLLLVLRSSQQPIRDAHDVIPERFPLALLVPNVPTLEQGDDEPLWLHEHHLRSADLGLH
jgi:hypothetical protein